MLSLQAEGGEGSSAIADCATQMHALGGEICCQSMLAESQLSQDVSGWDTSNVTDMQVTEGRDCSLAQRSACCERRACGSAIIDLSSQAMSGYSMLST